MGAPQAAGQTQTGLILRERWAHRQDAGHRMPWPSQFLQRMVGELRQRPEAPKHAPGLFRPSLMACHAYRHDVGTMLLRITGQDACFVVPGGQNVLGVAVSQPASWRRLSLRGHAVGLAPSCPLRKQCLHVWPEQNTKAEEVLLGPKRQWLQQTIASHVAKSRLGVLGYGQESNQDVPLIAAVRGNEVVRVAVLVCTERSSFSRYHISWDWSVAISPSSSSASASAALVPVAACAESSGIQSTCNNVATYIFSLDYSILRNISGGRSFFHIYPCFETDHQKNHVVLQRTFKISRGHFLMPLSVARRKSWVLQPFIEHIH